MASCMLSATMFAQSATDLASHAARAMQIGDYAEAEKSFLRLVVLMPDVPELYSNLGLAQYYEKKPDLARTAFVKSLSLKSDLFVPNFLLAKIDCEEGRFSESLPAPSRSQKLQPQEPASRHLLAVVLSQLGFNVEAIAQYQRLLKENSQDEEALYGLALAYLSEARRLSITLKSSDPRFAALLKAESDSTLPGVDAQAYEEWSNSVADLPETPGIRIPFADFLLLTKRLPEAVVAIQRELELDPFCYQALFRLAELNLLKGDLHASVDNLNRAVQIRPELFRSLPHPIVFPDSAEQAYATLSSEDESNEFGRAYLLCELAGKMGHPDEAAGWEASSQKIVDDLQRRIESQHDLKSSLLNDNDAKSIGLKYIREKRIEEGLELLIPLSQKSPVDARTRVVIARALVETDRFQETIEFLNRPQPHDPESLYLLISSYKALTISTMDELDRAIRN